MDKSHEEKAREAGEIPPVPSTVMTDQTVPTKSPPLSKKSFMALVLLILIGIICGIGKWGKSFFVSSVINKITSSYIISQTYESIVVA